MIEDVSENGLRLGETIVGVDDTNKNFLNVKDILEHFYLRTQAALEVSSVTAETEVASLYGNLVEMEQKNNWNVNFTLTLSQAVKNLAHEWSGSGDLAAGTDLAKVLAELRHHAQDQICQKVADKMYLSQVNAIVHDDNAPYSDIASIDPSKLAEIPNHV